MLGEGVWVSRHVDDLNFGAQRSQPICQFFAANVRHHDVGEKEVNRAPVLLRQEGEHRRRGLL